VIVQAGIDLIHNPEKPICGLMVKELPCEASNNEDGDRIVSSRPPVNMAILSCIWNSRACDGKMDGKSLI
jgi:hypothetical protein